MPIKYVQNTSSARARLTYFCPATQDPGRVWPGKKMAGRLGGERTTTQNLAVVRVDSEDPFRPAEATHPAGVPCQAGADALDETSAAQGGHVPCRSWTSRWGRET